MLTELHIRNLAVLERVGVRFGPGLNALTGETGAGKSLLVGALDLVLGARASSDLVRRKTEEAEITARFDLPADHFQSRGIDQGLDEGSLVLRRVIAADGRSRAYVNDRPATVGRLRELGATLADLHGQHEQQNLLREETHLDYLDAYAETAAAASAVREDHDACRALEDRLRAFREEAARSTGEREFLRFQLEELQEAGLVPGEEEELERERHRTAHGGRLAEHLGAAVEALSEGERSAVERLAEASRLLGQGASLDPGLEPLRRQLDEALVGSEEIARELARYLDGLNVDPHRIEEVEARLGVLAGLRRKYRTDASGLISRRDALREQMNALEDAPQVLTGLEGDLRASRERLAESCAALSAIRSRAAARLGREVTRELRGLGMEGARFRIDLAAPGGGIELPGGGHATARGAETAVFLLAANPGEGAGPIGRIASGGEASRVMLALKNVLRRVDPVPLAIFDEVDAGIGGLVAEAVGKRLLSVAGSRQVLVVTHLAVIAGKADTHFRLIKTTSGGRTRIDLEEVRGAEREEELARMLSGQAGHREARRTARTLLGGGNRG